MKKFIFAALLVIGAISAAVAFEIPEKAAHACEPNDPGCFE